MQIIVDGETVEYILPDDATIDLANNPQVFADGANVEMIGHKPSRQKHTGVSVPSGRLPQDVLWQNGALVDSVTYAFRLAQRRQATCDRIDALRDALFDRGCPYLGKRIQVDDSSRANIASMVLNASLAKSGALPWPASISQGWISLDNTRIALATPDAGIALGATVGDWYATARQNSRTLKDAALASDNPESIDITTGWPAG